MASNFCVDVETVGLESTCIVLSLAIVHFSFDEEFTYDELIKRSLFIKLNAKEQASAKRSVTKSTLDFWNDQSEEVRALAIKPHPNDMSVATAFGELAAYIDKHDGSDAMFWQRGTLDSTSLESLARTFEIAPVTNYNNWMDVRTAIRCLKESCTKRAYCTVPGFDPIVVNKHHPVDDICYDVMQLRYGI